MNESAIGIRAFVNIFFSVFESYYLIAVQALKNTMFGIQGHLKMRISLGICL